MEFMKDSIKSLKGYSPSALKCEIKLDANEGKSILLEEGFNFQKKKKLNFYPDSNSFELRKAIEKYIGIDVSKIIAGNGSSEMIDLLMKAFIDKGEGVLSFIPTFSMYKIYSQIYSAQFIGVESNKDFTIDIDKIIQKSTEENPKLILICNPNNPTGHKIDSKDIKKLIENTESLVVVDEAYMEFSEGSMVEEVDNYPNLVVLRTLSKAFGLAGIRLGYMISNIKIIEILNRVKSPYNLNSITQYLGIVALQRKDKVKNYIEEIKKEREIVYGELRSMTLEVYKSHGNFLFFRSDIKNLQEKLATRDILIRAFSGDLENYYRVSIGDDRENKLFLENIKEILNEKS